MIQVKVCGITRPEDLRLCGSLGVQAIGLNFWPGSKRFVTLDRAKGLLVHNPARINVFGVFVNASAEEIVRLVKAVGLDFVQLHGDETPEFARGLRSALPADCGAKIVKAIRVRDAASVREMALYAGLVDGILFDASVQGAFGGTGKELDYRLLAGLHPRPQATILSGGLNAENVGRAILTVKPDMVDVCSGVEAAPGIKDEARLRKFMEAVRTS